MNRYVLGGALGATACLCLYSHAFAHATLAVGEAAPNTTYRGVVRIGHGCAGSPTVSLTVRVPEGVIAAKPMPKPGWTLAISRGPYARTYDYFGTPMAEGAQEITWSGQALPDDQYDEFVFTARITDAFAPGTTAYVPVVQTCATGAHHWTAIPAAGQTSRDLKEPAPAIRIVAGPGAGPSSPAAAVTGPIYRAGQLTIEGPWIRATPDGARVAGGYLRVTNAGAEPDRLVASSVPLAARAELHEMSNEGGIMKMREVAGGIPIPAGGTVELKPGGLHLMFMDLKAGAREGETVSGTLTFEKAGTVAVTFQVGGLGARAAPAGGAHHHH